MVINVNLTIFWIISAWNYIWKKYEPDKND